ncbi:hypothetical protein CH369_13195 [Leptospira levettii]|nr:hypothetical protein CH369_13195 [Leptospira levettii]
MFREKNCNLAQLRIGLPGRAPTGCAYAPVLGSFPLKPRTKPSRSLAETNPSYELFFLNSISDSVILKKVADLRLLILETLSPIWIGNHSDKYPKRTIP